MRYVKALAAVMVVIAVVFPGASASASPDTIALIAPWGSVAYDSAVPKITVTYTISASPAIPPSDVDAVQAGIDHWNNCLYSGDDSFTETFGSNTFTATDTGCLSLSFAGDWQFVEASPGTRPLVKISIKNGGGLFAGRTLTTTDFSGFLAGARMQISAANLGSPNSAQTVWNIADHELGHVVGLGHSDVSTDLMWPVINGTVAFGSCEISGVEALYGSWLPGGNDPAQPSSNPVSC